MWIDDPKWISQLAAEPVDLEVALSRIVDRVAREVGAERATLFLLDRARGELVGRIGDLPELAEIRLRVGEGIAGTVAARRRSMNVGDAWRSPEFARRIDLETGFRTRSLIAAPILDPDERLLGVLEAVNHAAGDFSEVEEATLTRIAAKLAELLGATSLRRQLVQEQPPPLAFRFNGIVGTSMGMRTALDRAARAAPTDATVLIRGESGTGKELVARAIHVNSKRADGPLVKVDCAALPAELIENELFGHVRGAYTGADRSTPGKVASADGGTLFLDEIGELPAAVQGKLLRLVQERTWYPVGGDREHSADVRIVAATRRDLEDEVAAGRFREDLYYRLRVVEVELPPLRARGHGELDRLIDHLLFEACRRHDRPGLALSDEARRALHAQRWPGNVRELEHCIEAAVVLAPGSVLRPETLPTPRKLGPPSASPDEGLGELLPLREMERRYVARVVEACGGNRSKAARLLGIGRNTLARKLAAG